MENISWADRVRNEELLERDKVERNILHEISKEKANCIGHILCENCLLKHVVEGKTGGRIEVMGREGRRHMKLLYDLKENTEHCKLKEEALDHTVWRIGFGRDCGPVVRQKTK